MGGGAVVESEKRRRGESGGSRAVAEVGWEPQETCHSSVLLINPI